MAVGNREHFNLNRSQPQREGARVFFDKQSKSSFITADRGAVNDVGVLLLTVAVNVFHTELLGEELVNLNGNQGVLLAVDVLYLNIKLGPVERRLTYADFVGDFEVVEDFCHNSLRLVPLLRSTDILLAVIGIPLREAVGNVLVKPQSFKHINSKLQRTLKLLL